MIIDALSADKQTLYACMLTCRSWVYRAGWQLYSIRFLASIAQVKGFVRYLQRWNRFGVRDDIVLAVLGNDLNFLPTAWSKLAVVCGPAIRYLEVYVASERCVLGSPRTELLISASTTFCYLQHLHLRSISFTTFAWFTRLVTGFEFLWKLTLDDVSCEKPGPIISSLTRRGVSCFHSFSCRNISPAFFSLLVQFLWDTETPMSLYAVDLLVLDISLDVVNFIHSVTYSVGSLSVEGNAVLNADNHWDRRE